MNAEKIQLIEDFYCISALLNDNMMYVAKFFSVHTNTKVSYRALHTRCTMAQFKKLKLEINESMNISTNTYRDFYNQMVFLDECKDIE